MKCYNSIITCVNLIKVIDYMIQCVVQMFPTLGDTIYLFIMAVAKHFLASHLTSCQM